MPETRVVFYAESDGGCPVLDWLDRQQAKVQDKCIARIERLAELGHELRRPEADILRDGIHELRVSYRRVQYRLLYFFHEETVVLAHGLIKESKVPAAHVARAQRRRRSYIADPQSHIFRESGV